MFNPKLKPFFQKAMELDVDKDLLYDPVPTVTLIDYILTNLFEEIRKTASILFNERYSNEVGINDVESMTKLVSKTRKEIKFTLVRLEPFVKLEGDDLTIVNIFGKFYGEDDNRTGFIKFFCNIPHDFNEIWISKCRNAMKNPESKPALYQILSEYAAF